MPQSWVKNESAGSVSLRGLKERQECLCLRKTEANSLNGYTSFNRANVHVGFENLRELVSRQNFTANEIYKLDKTANSTVRVTSKIIFADGIKQMGCVTSGQRGTMSQ